MTGFVRKLLEWAAVTELKVDAGAALDQPPASTAK